MMYKYIDNVSDSTAKVLLHGEIGSDINGFDFASMLLYLENMGVKNCIISIISGGGRVDQGFSIFSAIRNSKMDIECVNDGIAYSTAGWLWLAGNSSKMADYAQWMCHNPSSSDDDTNIEVLQLFTNSIAKIICGITGKDESVVKDWMDKETFMDSSQLIDNGIIKVSQVYKTTKGKKPALIGNSVKEQVLICSSFINTLHEKKHKMTKVAQLLKLSNEASEEAIAEGVGKLISDSDAKVSDNESLKKENESLKSKLAEFEAKESVTKELAAVELVDNAIKAGKITATAKDVWVKMANASFEDTKSAFEAIVIHSVTKEAVKITNVIKVEPEKAGREAWTIREWETQDEKGLLEMFKNNKDEYQKLYNSFYIK